MSNRSAYLSFGLALLVGYGAFALSYGDDPILPIPSAPYLVAAVLEPSAVCPTVDVGVAPALMTRP